jgi:hypothetical protein
MPVILLSNAASPEEGLANILVEAAYQNARATLQNSRLALMWRTFILDRVREGLDTRKSLAPRDRAIYFSDVGGAGVQTLKAISTSLRMAWHASAHILPALGENVRLPFGPQGEGITAMFVRGASDLRGELLAYSDTPVRDYEAVFRENLPSLHLAIAIIVVWGKAAHKAGRPVSLVDLSHDFEAVKDIFAFADLARVAIAAQWPDRVASRGQVEFRFAA